MSFEAGDTVELLNELPEAFLAVTELGEVLFVNRALTALTGYDADDLVGKDISTLLPTPERRRVQVIEWFGRWANDPDSEQLRYLNLELLTRVGDTKLVSVRVSKHDIQDKPCFLVVLRDVTTQHETMAALRHAQLVTNRILAIGEDAILSVDSEQKLIYWNERAAQLFGYSESEIIGQPLSRLLPPNMSVDHSDLVTSFTAGKVASRMMGERGEIFGVHRDGRRIPLEASITKTTIDGQTVLSAQVRDITERKLREQALVASEARFRAIFEYAVEAMVLLSPDGRVLEINPAAKALLPDFEASKYFWELDWWHEQADPQVVQQSREGLRESVGRCLAGEVIRVRTHLGGTREVDFSMLPVNDADGRVVYIIAEARELNATGDHA